jgi:hypothetical protein
MMIDEPQTTDMNASQKHVRVETGQHFKWIDGFTIKKNRIGI